MPNNTTIADNDLFEATKDQGLGAVITRSITAAELKEYIGGGSSAVFSTGNGEPEGSVLGSPGDSYWDLDTNFEYRKVTGVGTNTGWMVH